MPSESQPLHWLLSSDEPWTRYRTLVDLLDLPESAPEVGSARVAMLAHPQVKELIAAAATWPGGPLKRHNDASHVLHKLCVLADMGIRASDPGMTEVIQAVMAHVSSDGAPLSLLNIAPAFGGSGQDTWTWMMCDAPSVLYALLLLHEGVSSTPSLSRSAPLAQLPQQTDSLHDACPANLHPTLASAANYLSNLAFDNGWHCTAAPEVGKFRGPGRRSDPCPIASVLMLKALARVPAFSSTAGIRSGIETLLGHWQNSQIARGVPIGLAARPDVSTAKPYLFGCGSDYRKLKYPFIWYDILHVLEALSPYPSVHSDPRFQGMLAAVISQADADGRYTAGAMYRSWKGWSFADKKRPSPWLTFLVRRIQRRLANTSAQSMSGETHR